MASVTQDRDFPGTSPPLPGDLVSLKRHFPGPELVRERWGQKEEVLGEREGDASQFNPLWCGDGMVMRTVELFSVYQKQQQRPPAGLCIGQGWHRAPAPTGRAARAVASRAGRKEQWWAWPTWRLVQEARGWEGGRQTG